SRRRGPRTPPSWGGSLTISTPPRRRSRGWSSPACTPNRARAGAEGRNTMRNNLETTAAQALLAAAKKGDRTAWLALLDLLEESGVDGLNWWAASLISAFRKEKSRTRADGALAEALCVELGLLAWDEAPFRKDVLAFQSAVAAVDLAAVPEMD